MHLCAYSVSVRQSARAACLPACATGYSDELLSREQGCQVVASLQASHFQPSRPALCSFSLLCSFHFVTHHVTQQHGFFVLCPARLAQTRSIPREVS